MRMVETSKIATQRASGEPWRRKSKSCVSGGRVLIELWFVCSMDGDEFSAGEEEGDFEEGAQEEEMVEFIANGSS